MAGLSGKDIYDEVLDLESCLSDVSDLEYQSFLAIDKIDYLKRLIRPMVIESFVQEQPFFTSGIRFNEPLSTECYAVAADAIKNSFKKYVQMTSDFDTHSSNLTGVREYCQRRVIWAEEYRDQIKKIVFPEIYAAVYSDDKKTPPQLSPIARAVYDGVKRRVQRIGLENGR